MQIKIPIDEQLDFYQMRMKDALDNHPNLLSPDFPEEYKIMLRHNIKKLSGSG